MNRISRQILQETGQEPIRHARGEDGDAEEKIRKILKISKEPISMESRSATTTTPPRRLHRGPGRPRPLGLGALRELREATKDVLDSLTPREAKVLRMRFGIEMTPTTRWRRSASSST